MQTLTDQEVMLEYQRGEAGAFAELLRRFKTGVYRFAYRLCLNCHEAEDITQEVFLKVHEKRLYYKPQAKFSTWVFAIAHNVFIDRWRKQKRFVLWPYENGRKQADISSDSPSPHESASINEISAHVIRGIQGLPVLQKEALILREFEHLDYSEIAIILKQSLGSIKTLIHRARNTLKNNLLPLIKEAGGSHV